MNAAKPLRPSLRSATSPVRGGFCAGTVREKGAPRSGVLPTVWGEMSRSDRGARARRAGRVSGLGDSDGPCLIAHHTRIRPGIPPPCLRSAPPFDKGGFAGPYVTARKRSPLSLSQNFTNFTRSTQNLPPLCKTFTAIVPYYGRNRRKTAVQLACFR